MPGELNWADGKAAVAKSLREAHRRRHREAGVERRLKAASRSVQAQKDRKAERDHERGAAAARRKRKRQENEELREGRKLRASLARAQRQAEIDRRPASFYEAFESKIGGYSQSAGARDLYYDMISRGFDSGRSRTDAGERKRNGARTISWSAGEFGGKIGYVARKEALEDVAGNIVSNMGDGIDEAKACAAAIEELEGMTRSNAGVYKHVIIALPHQLTPDQRVELLEELARPVRRLGLPFFAGLHKPDPKGDARNFHAHFLASLRPMTRHGRYDWSFSAGKLTWLDTPEGLRLQRRIVASAFNRALARAGQEVQWTSKSRADRGRESPGNNKKGQARTRAERALAEAHANLAQAKEEMRDIERQLDEIDRVEDISQRLDAAFARHLQVLKDKTAVSKLLEAAPPKHERAPERQPRTSDTIADVQERTPSSEGGSAGKEEPQRPAPSHRRQPRADGGADALRRRALEEEAERLRRERRRSTLGIADERAKRTVDEQRLTINDSEAFERLRWCLREEYGGGLFATRTPAGGLVILSYVRGQIDDAKSIARCEAGRVYLAVVADHLGPPSPRPGEPLSRTEVPAPWAPSTERSRERFVDPRDRGRER